MGRWAEHNTVYNKTISSASTVRCPVTQGTVLAPLFPPILIPDIDTNTNYSFVSVIAEVAKIGMEISLAENTEKLQKKKTNLSIGQ